MAQTQPRPPVDLSRHHHQQGAQHHLGRMCKDSGEMKTALTEGRLPSMAQALQASADLARFIGHLGALIEDDVLDAPQPKAAAA